jgi:hypothetical protein
MSQSGQVVQNVPAVTRWATLQEIVLYATLQWPVIQERISKRKSLLDSRLRLPESVRLQAAPVIPVLGALLARLDWMLVASGLSDQQMKKEPREDCVGLSCTRGVQNISNVTSCIFEIGVHRTNRSFHSSFP